MAAAPATRWWLRLRERAAEAEERCAYAHELLHTTVELLASPMHIADLPGGRARSVLVVAVLFEARSALAFAAATAAAAELHWLRGAAADPRNPLPSVADIPDDHESERRALGMLREARVFAEGAYDTVGMCGDRLLTANNLLEFPGLPGADGLIDAERDAAHGYLAMVANLAGVSSAYANTALFFLFPGLE